ncbi:LysE family translocator [Kiloniella antarctica]|uniref:LysE family translocator n=1 Tax=Kiloniella antarctica TaxID=1550907 RepID=A0ABW5BKQ1_9PROT
MSFLISVGVIWMIAAITPGPNLFMVLGAATTSNRAFALMTVLGIGLGTLIWGIAGWLGISALFAAAPMLYVVLKFVGAAYLIWMGTKMIWAARKPMDWSQKSEKSQTTSKSLKRAFLKGLTTNLANPKTAVFVTSLFAAALPENYIWSDGALSVLTMVSISLCWYALVAVAFTTRVMGQALAKAKRGLTAFAGTVFIGFGVRLVTAE